MNKVFNEQRKKMKRFSGTKESKRSHVVANTPDGLYEKCGSCHENVLMEDLQQNLYVCFHCGDHGRLSAAERLKQIADDGTFEETFASDISNNPLSIPGYSEKLAQNRRKNNMNEAVVTGTCQINGHEYAIAVMDSYFLMGSMGVVVGEKITALVEMATEKKLPLLIFSTSGGARMQEGILSLMQMAKTSAAIGRHHNAGLLYISVLTHPTTGGVSASFANLGDIIIAEPNALIGFAGPRVIKQTINQNLPEDFQRSEFLLEKGFVDQVVKREHLKDVLTKLSKLHRISERNGHTDEP
ncbi:MAG: acetyl-CoA carboxylase, carboxyltransferase subunit beta [Oscillospiraceae bacterium]|nr:acetyl-CoA carboxylase, carboxyltransferase subunit beta [Oscillospiraceae bacterium]